MYLEAFSPYSTRKRFGEYRKRASEQKRPMNDIEISQLVEGCGTYYYMRTLMDIRILRRSCQWQLYYITAFLDFRGLSRRGIDVASSWGVTLPLRTFDLYRQRHEQAHLKLMRYFCGHVLHVH